MRTQYITPYSQMRVRYFALHKSEPLVPQNKTVLLLSSVAGKYQLFVLKEQ
jgi:hypothetical protein